VSLLQGDLISFPPCHCLSRWGPDVFGSVLMRMTSGFLRRNRHLTNSRGISRRSITGPIESCIPGMLSAWLRGSSGRNKSFSAIEDQRVRGIVLDGLRHGLVSCRARSHGILSIVYVINSAPEMGPRYTPFCCGLAGSAICVGPRKSSFQARRGHEDHFPPDVFLRRPFRERSQTATPSVARRRLEPSTDGVLTIRSCPALPRST